MHPYRGTHRVNYCQCLRSSGFCTLPTLSTWTLIRSVLRPLNRSFFWFSLGLSTLLQHGIYFFFDFGGFGILLDFCPQHVYLYSFTVFLLDSSDGSIGCRDSPTLNLSRRS